MKSTLKILCMTALALGATASVARATTMQRMSLTELIQQSNKIVRGRIIEVTVTPAEDGAIWTRYALDTSHTLLGHLTQSKRFYFHCRGGQTDQGSEAISGIPRFTLGDEIIVFYSESNRTCQITGWSQGVLRVVPAPSGARVVLDAVGRAIEGFTDKGLVRGLRPDWWNVVADGTRTNDVLLVGVSHDARSALESAPAVVEDVLSDLGEFIKSLGSLRDDHASEGSPELVPSTADDSAAVAPTGAK